jgi:hypothetical protein
VARYLIEGKRVHTEIAEAPSDVRTQFATLLRAIAQNPRPGEAVLGVLPLKEGQERDEFTAPFDDGLLVYRIMPWVDYRVIFLIAVVWLLSIDAADPQDGSETG